MKKKYQSSKFKRFSAQRARSEDKARKRTKKRNRGSLTLPKPRQSREWTKPRIVTAPSLFSFTENPEKAIEFFTELDAAFAETPSGKHVFIDLESVTKMTPEVIVVLISRIEEERSTNSRASSGNVPRNNVARDMLASSGFYEFVKTKHRVKKPSRGAIEKFGDHMVVAEMAARLIENVAKPLGMSTHQEDGHQTTAVECMTNTREHASGHQSNRKGRKKWWFSVYRDPGNKVAQFAFVDLGIGIFVSLERQKPPWVVDLMAKLGSEKRTAILKKLLTDQTGQTADKGLPIKKRTSTKEAHRGKGLPNIARRNREKQTRRLRIISNNVFANVEESQYLTLEQGFSGTIICWEHWTTDYERQHD
jgi:hypothetical protein